MNIYFSRFYKCICSSDGGAIYFSSSNSNLRMICANRCSCGTSSQFHFACLMATQSNQVEYLSISNCTHTISGFHSMIVHSGFQRVDNTNSSMNNVLQGSGISISSSSTFTSSHCTFSNNNASQSICINLYYCSGAISFASIVNNNSPSFGGVVIVQGTGLPKMMYCIFQNNQNYLFCVWIGSLEVSHSFIEHSESLFSSNIAVFIETNNSFTKRTTYRQQFFHSLHCNADMPISEHTKKIHDQTHI